MTTNIDERYVDVSDVRPVPDHQEIFADGETGESLIVEVVETAAAANDACGQFYFEDQASMNDATSATLLNVSVLSGRIIESLPQGSYACAVTGRISRPSGVPEGSTEPVLLHMAILRLPQPYASDILIMSYAPLEKTQETGKSEPLSLRQALDSLSIKDYSLFG